jgi:hypothetical protein
MLPFGNAGAHPGDRAKRGTARAAGNPGLP